MTPREKALAEIQAWYDALPCSKDADSAPDMESIAVALVLLERLKSNFDLNLDSHLAPGTAQIEGVSRTVLKNMLAALGQVPASDSKGGRIDSVTPAIAEALLNAIRLAGLEYLEEDECRVAFQERRGSPVEKVREFSKRQCLKLVYDPTQGTRQFFADLMEIATQMGKDGLVAQYLVGAKLQLRFPNIYMRNESYSAADDSSDNAGVFVVEDTVFHVTATPTPSHFEKCMRHLQDGRRVFLLVPETFLEGARQNAEFAAPGRITVESIESFLANLIELNARFSAVEVDKILVQLCEQFNALVAKWEPNECLSLEVSRISDSPVIRES